MNGVIALGNETSVIFYEADDYLQRAESEILGILFQE